MSVTCIELTFHTEESGIHIYLHFFRYKGLPSCSQVVVLPEWSYLTKLPLCLFRDIEDIAVTLLEKIQFVHNELHSILWENRRSAIDGRLITGQQGLVLNIYIHLRKNVLQHQCPLHYRRLIQILLIAFCCKDSALCIYIWFLIQNTLAICLHSWCQGSEMRYIFHFTSPIISITIYFHFVRSLYYITSLSFVNLNFVQNVFKFHT